MPSTLSMCSSVSTTSKGCFSSRASALPPLWVAVTAWPAFFITCSRFFRATFSSSTIRSLPAVMRSPVIRADMTQHACNCCNLQSA